MDSIYTLLNLLWFPRVSTALRNTTGIMIIPLTQVIVSGCTGPSIPLIGPDGSLIMIYGAP